MRKEILAGFSSFFTASYLILLYPKILSVGGIDFGACLIATVLTIFISTTALAFYSDFPVLLAPGLSVGPYLVYTLILKHGADWQTILGLVFWSGLLLFILSITKVRQKILQYLPIPIKTAAIAGIGLYLICVAIKNLHLQPETVFSIQNGIVLFGLIAFSLLQIFHIRSSFILTILSCWALALFFSLTSFDGIIGIPHIEKMAIFKLDLKNALSYDWLGSLISITFICLFDTSAALSALAKFSDRLDSKGNIKNIDRIVIPDGLGSMVGAMLGTGTLSYLLESFTGIKAGGKGKVTAITAASCSFLTLFFYPLFVSIPLFATTPVMIAIGFFMMLEMKNLKWKNYSEWLPSVITLFTIPFTFSIYLGFAFGFISYIILKGVRGEIKEVHPVCLILALIFSMHLSWGFATNHF